MERQRGKQVNDILSSFIVFEGLDGSGKSTQARILANRLEQSTGGKVVLTAEPTDRPIGALVRSVLRHQVCTTSRALALLYAADRSDHLFNDEDGIAGLLDRGRVVISDRYFYSSLSYQGVTEDMSWLRSINDYPHPQYVIFVDTPAAECMKRIDSRGEEKELFDRIDYLERVRSNFNIVFETLPDGVEFLKVDGMEPVEVQADRIASFVSL